MLFRSGAGKQRLNSLFSKAFAAAAPASVVVTREFPAMYHEIFNEPDQAKVLDTLAGWLASRGH